VTLKKSFGFGATVSQQVALIFSVVGILSTILLWPIFITLYFTGVEVIRWSSVPWELITEALLCSLFCSMLENFGVTCTFEFFITAGLLISIPISAGLQLSLIYDNDLISSVNLIQIEYIYTLSTSSRYPSLQCRVSRNETGGNHYARYWILCCFIARELAGLHYTVHQV